MSQSGQHDHDHDHEDGQANQEIPQEQAERWNDPAAMGGQPKRPSKFQIALFWLVQILMVAAVLAPAATYLVFGFEEGVIAGFTGLMAMWLFRFMFA